MPILKVDTTACVKLTAKLEKLHKSAFPSAVRGTLNKAAFDVKQNTMLKSSRRTFVNRKENFFKANSNVTMAQGYDVPSMRSAVGFISSNLKYNNFAVKELDQQEYGGKIPQRDFIPLDEAREGNNVRQAVRPGNRLRSIRGRMQGTLRNIIDSSKGPGTSKSQQFIKSAIYAGAGGYVIGNFGKQILYRIVSIRKRAGQMIDIKKTKLYSLKPGRSVAIRQTGFMRRASNETATKLTRFYNDEAQRQFQRFIK